MNFLSFFSAHKKYFILAMICLVLIGAGIAVLVLSQPKTVNSIELNVHTLTLTSETSPYQLEVKTEPEVPASDLLWQTSDPTVVTVNRNGLLTPVGNGTAMITVCGRKGAGIDHCAVTVCSIRSLELSTHELRLAPGETRSLLCLTDPEDTELSLEWQSSDPAVVSVVDGTVTALSVGEAQVTVSAAGLSDTCRVSVLQDIPVEGLSLEITEFTFDDPEDRLILTPHFVPENTSRRDLIWFSTDEQIATVDPETFEVTPLSNGTCTVTAKTPAGDFEASCTVTVKLNIPLKGITLPKSGYTFTGLGQTYRIAPNFDPVNASNKNIIWTSSDPAVAKVSPTGIVTSVKSGTAKISLKTEDGGFEAAFTVTVSPSAKVKVTGLKLASYLAELKKIGDTYTLKPTVLPETATDRAVSFSSKNPEVAKVSSSGVVTATGYGTTEIVVRTHDGEFSENFFVSVRKEQPVAQDDPVSVSYVKGVWVATVSNLNFPSKSGLSAEKLKAELDTIMENTAKWGLNTVYLQVRPCGDALYESSYYPASAYVTGTQGNPLPFDILAYAVEAAHSRGLALHAWLNPYRVTTGGTSTSKLASTNPAVVHPEWLCTDGSRLYLNPGLPEVRQYIIDGALEIVKKYDVDGIHFDDYFYPDDLSKWDDSAAYAKYGNGMTLANWRRDNNDKLVHDLYTAIKATEATTEFGISPAPVWALASNKTGGVPVPAAYQTYSDCYADTKKWVQEGWLDYICPQVYFQMDHPSAPFKPIVQWWNELTEGSKVRLYIGIGAYRCDSVDAYKSGKEIPAQLDYLDTMKNVDGAVFYSYDALNKNSAGIGDQLRARYYKEPLSTTLQFDRPSQTLDMSYTYTYIVGVSDPDAPLYADGVAVPRDSTGYFAYRVELTGNKVTVRFTHKGQTEDYVITRRSSGSGSSDYLSSFSFESGSFTPSYDFADRSGTTVKFSCVAPAGSQVYVKIGSYVVDLTTTTADPKNGKYKKATYTGSLTLPQVDDDGNASLGYAVFYASRNGESTSYSPGCQIEIINDPSAYAMVVSADKSDIRPNLKVTPEVYYIATAGAKFNAVSKADGVVKLTNGMYMATSDVTRLKAKFGPVKVKSMTLTAAKKYTVLGVGMSDCAFHTVWMGENTVEITLYGLSDANLTAPSVGSNPLFASAKVEKIDGSTARIELTYKKALHIYGYYCNFDGTTLYVNFRNPVTLSEGSKPLTGVVISIDPGHSQKAGATARFNGKTYYEYVWNLDLSQRVATRLRDLGATVVLTHQGEGTYSLDELIPQYRALSPDVNVSIHFNDVSLNVDPKTRKGTNTYWCYGNSHLLADVMLDTFCANTPLKKDYSVWDYYKVSRLCEFPSILFEAGYIRNPDDFAYFSTEAGMDEAADAIAEGIYAFFREQNN